MSRRCRSTPLTVAAPARTAARSSSLSAAATQVASPSTADPPRRGARALTTPPAPRRDVKVPSSRRWKLAGPRLLTTITSSAQFGEQVEPVLELPGRQEVVAHVLAALRAHGVGSYRIG